MSVLGMGGKAADASWVLGELGRENLATGFAAGDTGKLMEKMLRRPRLPDRFCMGRRRDPHKYSSYQ